MIITNDGATILNKMTVTQPAAKMLVELAKSQVRSQTRRSITLVSELLPVAEVLHFRMSWRVTGPHLLW